MLRRGSGIGARKVAAESSRQAPTARASRTRSRPASPRRMSSSISRSGTATKAGQTVKFDTGIFAPTAPLEGLAFDHQMDTSPGTVRLTVDLGQLLSRVEFDKTNTQPNAEGVTVFDPASPAFNGLSRGAVDTATYQLSWQSN